MANKRYYWLKLHDDFFRSLRIKKMRRLPEGNVMTIIYLEIQLLAMKKEGTLTFSGLEESFAEELALDIDEDAEVVKTTMDYLLSCGLAETNDGIRFFFPYSVENVGSEGSSAMRMRTARASQCDTQSAQCAKMCAQSDGEKEIEKEIEIDIDTRDREEKLIRNKYGEHCNVELTEEELARLKAECPIWKEYIERLSSYMAAHNKNYPDHLKTMLSWYKQDEAKKPAVNQHSNASYDLDKWSHDTINKKLNYERKTG